MEIIKGYVPGFDGALGHEFVGVVEECAAAPDLVGTLPVIMRVSIWTCTVEAT